jgi:hypothetical protein
LLFNGNNLPEVTTFARLQSDSAAWWWNWLGGSFSHTVRNDASCLSKSPGLPRGTCSKRLGRFDASGARRAAIGGLAIIELQVDTPCTFDLAHAAPSIRQRLALMVFIVSPLFH